MAEKEPFGFQKPPLSDQELTARLDRVDELVNLMLDDNLEDPHIDELEKLLSNDPKARLQYLSMMQLHTDLIEYYKPDSSLENISPVLANLSGVTHITPPTSDQAQN